MIYTLTLNPSIDYIVSVDNFEINKTNRTSTESITAGGKGINVSIMLKSLGHKSTALGFVAGFTGKKINEELKTGGIDAKFIFTDKGYSRINLKISNLDGTEINGQGPDISEDNLLQLKNQLQLLQSGDILVLSGNVPRSCPTTIYRDIMHQLSDKHINFIVDSNKDLLVNTLPEKPFLIKPNIDELSEIFDTKIDNNEKVIHYAKKLIDMGAKNVLVSMGKYGAIFLDSLHNVYTLPAPSGKLINSVGAGDSMVAGFIYGCLKDLCSVSDNIADIKNFQVPFKWAVAAGSATAFSQNFATLSKVRSLVEQLDK